MRGTGSNHVLVTINGISINDQSTTQGLHDFGVDFIQQYKKLKFMKVLIQQTLGLMPLVVL